MAPGERPRPLGVPHMPRQVKSPGCYARHPSGSQPFGTESPVRCGAGDDAGRQSLAYRSTRVERPGRYVTVRSRVRDPFTPPSRLPGSGGSRHEPQAANGSANGKPGKSGMREPGDAISWKSSGQKAGGSSPSERAPRSPRLARCQRARHAAEMSRYPYNYPYSYRDASQL